MQISILHWMVFAIVIGLVAGAVVLFGRAIGNRRPSERRLEERSAAATVDGPSGFQGWLVLLAIGVFLAPVFTVIRLIDALPEANDSFANEFHYMFDGDIILHVAVLLLEICTIFFMLRRSRNFVSLYIAAGICLVLLTPLELVWMSGFLSWHEGKPFMHYMDNLISPDAIQRTISTAIAAAIWITYVIRSRRVANTFVR